MKINDAPRPAAARRAPGARRQSDFAARVGGRPEERGRAGPAAPLAAPDAILSLQEVTADGAGSRRAVERAHDMLDELEKLRLAMIEGWLPETALRRLADLVDDRDPESGDDPRLEGVVQDVEVRAAVEIAKRDRRGRSDADEPGPP